MLVKSLAMGNSSQTGETPEGQVQGSSRPLKIPFHWGTEDI